MVSGKDQKGQTKLKFRQMGQASVDEIQKKDFKKDLDVKEQKYVLENDKTTAWMAKEASSSTTTAPLMIKFQADVPSSSVSEIAKKYDDDDIEDVESQSSSNESGSDDGFDSSSR
jgi:protein CWC15